MPQFRFRKTTRFISRVRHRANGALFTAQCHVHIIGVSADASIFARQIKRALSLAVTATFGIGLLTLGGTARAQSNPAAYTHDITLHFQTDDLAHPNGNGNGGQLASMWEPDLPGGFSYTYNLTASWDLNTTFGSFTDFKIPAIDLGPLGTIPAIDLGEWGAGGQLFTKGQNTGLIFQALASAGGVSIDYPLHVQISTPEYVRAGYPVKVHVTYVGDGAAQVKTYSPQATATMSFNANIQLYAKGRLELAGANVFNSELLDFCSRTDTESPKYGQAGSDKSLTTNVTLVDTNDLIKKAVNKATINIGEDPASPEATISFNLPVVNTIGQPGSYSNYQNGAGGSGSVGHGASYEYTTGITIPDEVLNNPNATYARGQDDMITLTADFTNILTTSLQDADIPVPPLDIEADLTKNVTLHAGLLDFTGSLSLGFLQEFGFVPLPQISFTIDGVGTTSPVDIDPVNGTDITFTMPGDPNSDNPTVPISVLVTPHITLGNDFISNTYFNLSGSLGLDPIILSSDSIDLGKGVRIPSFSFDPFPLSVGASVPIPLHKATFEIPFDSQDGAPFYIKTRTPPLASLVTISPNLIYVDERDTIDAGVSVLGVTLYANPTPEPGNDYAAPWLGAVYPGTASEVDYATHPYWDQVVQSNLLFWDGSNTDPNGLTYSAVAALFYSASNSRPDLTPGIHHIYTSNTATTTTAPFGPRITSLPISVAYPQPHVDDIGWIGPAPQNTGAPAQDPTDPFRYAPFRAYEKSNLNNRGWLTAGEQGFTIVAVDNTTFTPTNSLLDPGVAAPFAEGSYSRIKMDGKLLAPDPAFDNRARSWVTGIIPASMLATAGLKKIQITNPTAASQGGDSNFFMLRVWSPQPTLTDVTVVQQGAVGQKNTVAVNLNSHQITAGSTDTQISITGSGLTPDTKVYFNDPQQASPLQTKFVNSGLIYATIPASAITQPLQSPVVTLVNASSGSPDFGDGGTANGSALHVIANTPKISDVLANGTDINAVPLNSPNDIPITIKGVHFWPNVTLAFGPNSLPVTFVDTQTLTAKIPASLLAEPQARADQAPLLVKGTDYDGNSVRSNPFGLQMLYAPPVLRGANGQPAVLPVAIQANAGPSRVTITGGLFYKESKVTFNTESAPVDYIDSMHLNVTIPPDVHSTVGNYQIVVTNPMSNGTDGKPLNDGGKSNAFTFQVLKYAPQGQLTIKAVLFRLPFSSSVTAQITLTNTGTASTAAMAITNATLANALGTPLPAQLPAVGVGQSTTLTLNFAIPVSMKGQIATLSLNGSEPNATCTMSTRVTLP